MNSFKQQRMSLALLFRPLEIQSLHIFSDALTQQIYLTQGNGY